MNDYAGRKSRSPRLLLRAPAGHRLAGLVARMGVAATATGWPRAPRATGSTRRCRSTRCTSARGGARTATSSTTASSRTQLADYVQRPGLHARRADADHRASVLRLVGLPDDRLLRADRALRHAAGSHVLRRSPAPERHRRDSRLGALALSHRRARPDLLRRHAPVRARRSAPGLSPGMELRHLQLRPQRGPQLPDLLRAVLARSSTTSTACASMRVASMLYLDYARKAGRMDSEPLRRPGESRGHRLPARR